MKYSLYKEVDKIVNKSVHIIGATRSGTTFFELLISSLRETETFDEPPMLRVLMPLIDKLKKEDFKLLFNAYLFEERLMCSIPGRNLNLNLKDQTSIYNSKSKEEILRRIQKSYRRLEIFPMALKSTIAFKQVEVGQYLSKLIDYYPNFKTILILRKPAGVVSSILEKKWFSKKQLFNKSGKWFFKKGKKWNVPDWLPKNKENYFLKLSEAERSILYYIYEYKNFKSILKKKKFKPIVVDYDDFTNNSKILFLKISKKLNLKYGSLTKKLLKEVKVNKKKNKISKNLIRSKLYLQAVKLYNELNLYSIK